jgi:hypothetical protein
VVRCVCDSVCVCGCMCVCVCWEVCVRVCVSFGGKPLPLSGCPVDALWVCPRPQPSLRWCCAGRRLRQPRVALRAVCYHAFSSSRISSVATLLRLQLPPPLSLLLPIPLPLPLPLRLRYRRINPALRHRCTRSPMWPRRCWTRAACRRCWAWLTHTILQACRRRRRSTSAPFCEWCGTGQSDTACTARGRAFWPASTTRACVRGYVRSRAVSPPPVVAHARSGDAWLYCLLLDGHRCAEPFV